MLSLPSGRHDSDQIAKCRKPKKEPDSKALRFPAHLRNGTRKKSRLTMEVQAIVCLYTTSFSGDQPKGPKRYGRAEALNTIWQLASAMRLNANRRKPAPLRKRIIVLEKGFAPASLRGRRVALGRVSMVMKLATRFAAAAMRAKIHCASTPPSANVNSAPIPSAEAAPAAGTRSERE